MAGSRSRRPPEAALRCAFAAVLDRHLPLSGKGPRLAVGLSGGLDSVVLLHLARELAPRYGARLGALHVHHGLSPNADAWAGFCERLCADWSIPLQVERVAVARGDSLEAAAREARYAAYRRLAADWLLLGHQRDDQVETVLFNLLRGAGVRGAAGMPAMRLLREGERPLRLLRPLLEQDRDALRAYALAEGLAWVEDESNGDLSLSRNFLRGEVLPLIGARFPAARASLAGAARRFAEAEGLLQALAAQDFAACADARGRLEARALAALDPARQRNLLRHALARVGAPLPDEARLEEARRQLVDAREDAAPRVDLGECALRRYRGVLHVVPREAPAPRPVAWNGEPALPWGGSRVVFEPSAGAGLARARALQGGWRLDRRRGGERLRMVPGGPSRSLKNLLQEAGVPAWEREALPLLFFGEKLVWVPGVGVDCDYRCLPGQPGVAPRWEAAGF